MALGKWQMVGFTSWKGTSKDNHIGAIYRKSPQKASDVMIQLLSLHYGKNTEAYLKQFPVKYFDNDDDYFWEVIGSSRRNIPLLEARREDGSIVAAGDVANVGVGGSPFYLVFSEDWFADGNMIVGELNEVYPILIKADPKMEGSNAVYKCEMAGGVTEGMPAGQLVLGKRFSVEYSPVERGGSRKVGDVRFSTPISMRNEFSQIRIQHKAEGDMINKKVAVGIPFVDGNGKKVVSNMWMSHVELTIEQQFSEEKSNVISFGVSNRNSNGEYLNIGKSGNVIRQGDGLRAQMAYGNTIYYNNFSLKLIEDALTEISTTKLGFGERRFILKTGERGATQFHKAVLDTVSGWKAMSFLNAQNPAIISKTSSNLHDNAMSAGFQFTEFKAPNGVIVKVEVDPFYDDPVRNKIMHPNGGVAESYRYDILYIGTNFDAPNIQLAKIKNHEEVRGIQWGLRDPFTGRWGNENMSFDEDAAVYHRMWWGGVFILDATRTMSLIPNLLRG